MLPPISDPRNPVNTMKSTRRSVMVGPEFIGFSK
jgi:hypothetical protein